MKTENGKWKTENENENWTIRHTVGHTFVYTNYPKILKARGP